MKYRCEVRVEGYMTVEVEAESHDEAVEKALDKFEDEYFHLPIADLQCKNVEADVL